MPRGFSWGEYFETFERTNAVVQKLEAFCEGRETTASLEVWARALWETDGTEDGPLRTHSQAKNILENLFNADEKEDPQAAESRPMLREQDALEYIRYLRRGPTCLVPRDVACVVGTLAGWAERLRTVPVRHILAGLGWYEFARFASPGTGRVFVMRSPVANPGGEVPWHPTIATEAGGPASECVVDLLETLGIDRSDVSWFAEEFAGITLPEWVACRQDDNGIRAEVARFTGYRKAMAALANLEAGHHKQAYWVEGLAESVRPASRRA